jgi:energy-coupling factor transport system permease protein
MREKSEFEHLIKLSVGQYIPTGSVMHHLDPRIKVIMGILLVMAAIIIGSLISAMILLAAVIFGLSLTRVQLKLALASLRHMAIFLLVLALIQIFTIPQLHSGASMLFQRGILKITDRSLISGILLIFRFVVIVLGLSLFSFSTSTTELIHSIEHLLRPLQKIGFPAHELALTAHISIRFIPILAGEAEQLMKAQASRGADFAYRKWNFVRKIRKMLPLLVPLFVVSLKHAHNLIEAMESRCYMGGKGRTSLIRLHAGFGDYLTLAVGCAVIASALLVSFADIDRTAFEWVWKNITTLF